MRVGRVCRVVWLMVAAWLGIVASAGAEERVLFDFEMGSLGEQWAAQGPVAVARQPLPAPVDVAGPGAVPTGQAIRLRVQGEAAFLTRRGQLPPLDFPTTRSVAFWVYRAPGTAEPTTLELQCYEPDNKTRFWRKLVLDHTGWKRVEAPLRWMRWSEGRVPRWDQVDRLVFYFRGAADLWIDTITVDTGTPEAGAEWTVDELAAVAFPHLKPSEVRRAASGPALVLTDALQLDAPQLAAHLAKVAAAVNEEFAFLPAPARPAPLVVFAAEADYREFPPRLAQVLGGEGAPARSGGFTAHGIAMSSWSDEYGTLRPVYAHEFVHALLDDRLLLGNQGEWLHEGLAVRYQLRFHPQADFAALVRQGLAQAEFRDPLEDLADGEPIALDRYWQAATLVGLLIDSPQYRPRLPALVRAFQAAGSSRLAPHVETVLETDFARLWTDWEAYCRQTYESAP